RHSGLQGGRFHIAVHGGNRGRFLLGLSSTAFFPLLIDDPLERLGHVVRAHATAGVLADTIRSVPPLVKSNNHLVFTWHTAVIGVLGSQTKFAVAARHAAGDLAFFRIDRNELYHGPSQGLAVQRDYATNLDGPILAAAAQRGQTEQATYQEECTQAHRVVPF